MRGVFRSGGGRRCSSGFSARAPPGITLSPLQHRSAPEKECHGCSNICQTLSVAAAGQDFHGSLQGCTVRRKGDGFDPRFLPRNTLAFAVAASHDRKLACTSSLCERPPPVSITGMPGRQILCCEARPKGLQAGSADEGLLLQSREARLHARSRVLVDQLACCSLVQSLHDQRKLSVSFLLGRLRAQQSTETLDRRSQRTALLTVPLTTSIGFTE